jgi:hypothetical protein
MYKSLNQEIKTIVYSQPCFSTCLNQPQPFADANIEGLLRLLKNALKDRFNGFLSSGLKPEQERWFLPLN